MDERGAMQRSMPERIMRRRTFLTLSAAAAAEAVLPIKADAAVLKPYSFEAIPPMDNINAYLRWMQDNRGEDPR